MPTRSTALRRVQGSPKPPSAPWGRHNDNRWSKGKSQADSRALNFIASNFALQPVPPSSLHICTLPGPCLERPEREQGCCKLGPRSWQMRWHSPAALTLLSQCWHCQPVAKVWEWGCLSWRTGGSSPSRVVSPTSPPSLARAGKGGRAQAGSYPRQTRGCGIIRLNVSVPNSPISDSVFIVL